MKKYVQILNGKANPIVIEEDKVDELRANGVEIIDITDISPQPQVGWIYDSETKIFSAPEVVQPVPITTISNIDFWHRFTQAEQETLVNSSNSKVKAFLYELRLRPLLNLTNQRLITAINALESADLVGVRRAAEILEC